MQSDPNENILTDVEGQEEKGLNTSEQILDQMAEQSGAAPVEEESDEVALEKLEKLQPTEGANVRLAKSRHKEALPEGLTNIGTTSVEIPNKAQQIAGFYVKDAGVLVAQFRQYKFRQNKGQENDQHITI